ncbi:efflux RND transporter periplasmic adaptor subunit [Rhodocaloribacter sp.]
MMKRPRLFFLAVVLLVVLVGAGLLLQGERGKAAAELIVRPASGPFRVTVTTTGELQAKRSVRIYGPSGARRARIYEMKILRLVPEGTVVRKGDFVAQLDKSELNSRIQDAQTELRKAQSQYTQTQLDTSITLSKIRDELVDLRYAMEESRLRKEQAAYEPPSVQRQAEIDFEKAGRAHTQAVKHYAMQVQQAVAKIAEVEAVLTKSRRQIDDLLALVEEFTIRAPEKGMVIYKRDWRGQRTIVGSTVSAWDPVVATLPDLSVMESITYVNEVDIRKIEIGRPVEIGLDADPDKRLTGRVTRISNIGEQRPNTDAKVFEVAIEVNEADSTLRPAMTTSNTIIVAEVSEALSLPLECIHATDSLTYVFVKEGGGVMRQEVRLGLLNENEAIVEAGLATEDPVYLSIPARANEAPIRRLAASDVLAERQDER